MKSKIILAILIIAVIGCCNIVTAENIDVIPGSVQDLEHVEYRDYEKIYFNGNVTITYLFSVLNEEYISVESTYYPSENETKCKFTSHEIEPEWWMNFSEDISFFYILNETFNESISIGKIFVDYSELEIPMSPWEENLTVLNETYIELLNNHGILSTNYTNIYKDYNATLKDFNDAEDELDELGDIIIDLKKERDTAVGEHDMLNASLQENMTKYNNTYNLLIDAGKNVSYYRMFYDGMVSYNKDGFWFNNVYYLTIDEQTDIIQGLKNDLGIAPLYTILAITLTGLILFFIFRVVRGKQNPTAIQIERDFGYTPESRKIDGWVNKHILRKNDVAPAEKPVVPVIPVKQEPIKPIETKEEKPVVIPEDKPDIVAPTMKEDIISAVKNELESMLPRIVADAITASEKKGKPA